jgi:presenilin-like A22 family membrane protease
MIERVGAIGLLTAIAGALLLHATDVLALDLLGGLLAIVGVSLDVLATVVYLARRLSPDPPAHDAAAHHTAVAASNRRSPARG